tara:strand:+ start:1127 stop:1288 length:162 start_codon:yes stop_codon:yes gene_type:complete
MDILTIFNCITAVVTAASVICAATPSPKDDAFMAKWIYPVIEAVAINIGKAKQ